jgi:hypothetical protein
VVLDGEREAANGSRGLAGKLLDIFEDVKVEAFAKANKIISIEARNHLEKSGAKIPDGHAHRLRDTFAGELLLAGVPLERVSVLRGHTV